MGNLTTALVHDNEAAMVEDFNKGFKSSIENIQENMKIIGGMTCDFLLGGKITASGDTLTLAPFAAYNHIDEKYYVETGSKTIAITRGSNSKIVTILAEISDTATTSAQRLMLDYDDNTTGKTNVNTELKRVVTIKTVSTDGATASAKNDNQVKIAEIVVPASNQSTALTINECTRKKLSEENIAWTEDKSATIKLLTLEESFEFVNELDSKIESVDSRKNDLISVSHKQVDIDYYTDTYLAETDSSSNVKKIFKKSISSLYTKFISWFKTDSLEIKNLTISGTLTATARDANKVNRSLTIVGKTFDGSAAVDVSKTDLGINNVTNVATTSTITSGSNNNITSGAVYNHTSNTSNPHNVTKDQVGLGNVSNTGDSATPVSGGTTKFTTGGAYTELSKKLDKTANAVSATKLQNARTIKIKDASGNTGAGTSFDGTGNIELTLPTNINGTITKAINDSEGNTFSVAYVKKLNASLNSSTYVASIAIPNGAAGSYLIYVPTGAREVKVTNNSPSGNGYVVTLNGTTKTVAKNSTISLIKVQSESAASYGYLMGMACPI